MNREEFIYQKYLEEVVRQIKIGNSCHLSKKKSVDIIRRRYPLDKVPVRLTDVVSSDPIYRQAVDSYMLKEYGYKFGVLPSETRRKRRESRR